MTKFLVIWSLQVSRLVTGAAKAVLEMPEYAQRLEAQGKIEKRYHIVGKHGGAWIYKVESHEELERLLALAPVYNFAEYTIYPLAEMQGQTEAVGPQ